MSEVSMLRTGSESGKVFVAILGNLSSGKTEVSEGVHARIARSWLVPEGVNEWIKCGILQAYYDDPFGMAYPFQQHAFATRMCSYKKIDWKNCSVALSDSHILGDRYVFVEHLAGEGKFTPQQVLWYEQYYYEWKQLVPECDPDVIVYLRTDPQCCYERMVDRKRKEEVKIPLSYLEGIHDRLESLVRRDEIIRRVITVDSTREFADVVDDVERIVRNALTDGEEKNKKKRKADDVDAATDDGQGVDREAKRLKEDGENDDNESEEEDVPSDSMRI